jgi:hypothetical protein
MTVEIASMLPFFNFNQITNFEIGDCYLSGEGYEFETQLKRISRTGLTSFYYFEVTDINPLRIQCQAVELED